MPSLPQRLCLPGFRHCTACQTALPVSEFFPRRNRPSGYLSECKDCTSRRSKEWRRRNPDKVVAINRRNYDRERRVEYNRRWIAANPEIKREQCRRWRANNPEKVRLSHLRYYAENKQAAFDRYLVRRARKAGAAGACSREQLSARWNYYGGRCWICGAVAGEVDHVIPLSCGGSNWPANLRPACGFCNRSKGTRDWREFISS